MNASVELGFRNWLDDLIETPVFTGSNDGEVPSDALAIIISCPMLETVVAPLYRATVEVVVQGPASHEPIQDYRDVAAEVLDYLRTQNLSALADDLLAASDYYFGGLWIAQSSESVDDEYWRHTIELRVGLKREQDGTLWRNGLSAYEIAVVNGFGGTEEEWLESLAGPPGAPGNPGAPGAPGETITAITDNGNGTLTVTTNATSYGPFQLLNGPAGPQGDPGPPGDDALWNFTGAYNPGAGYAVGDVATYDGQTWYRLDSHGGNVGDTPAEGQFWTLLSAKGALGDSAYDIAVANGFLGNEAAWLASLVGAAGSQGPAGPAGPNSVSTSTASTITGLIKGAAGNLAAAVAGTDYAAAAHSHAIADVTGLQTALDGKQASGSYAAASHSHAASDITSGTLADARLSANVVLTGDSRLTDARTPTSHGTSHQAGGADAIKLDDLATPDDNTDLNATTSTHGLLPKLGGGTANFLRADGTWAVPPGNADVRIYTANDTWTNPSPSTRRLAYYRVVGGGGGGGAGRKADTGVATLGGGGGAGGCVVSGYFWTDQVGNLSVTVGAGGAGGASVTVLGAVGSSGAAGGDSVLGAVVTAKGGNGGSPGGVTAAAGGPSQGSSCAMELLVVGSSAGGAGGSAGGAGTQPTQSNFNIPGGGGGGGGVNTSDVASSGGYGQRLAATTTVSQLAGGGIAYNSASVTGDGGAGQDLAFAGVWGTMGVGMGGGGGGASNRGSGGAGGAGGFPGGGGGGGGGARSQGNSGAGGRGGDGVVIIVVF